MSEATLTSILLATAGLILPAVFLALCVWLKRSREWWFTYVAYFFLFGALGGWCFAFAMSPSGIAAASLLFLVGVAFPATLISSGVLQFRKQRSRAAYFAMLGGYSYPVCLAVIFGVGFLLHA